MFWEGRKPGMGWDGMEPGIILPITKHRLGVSIAEKFCIGRELDNTLSSPPHV